MLFKVAVLESDPIDFSIDFDFPIGTSQHQISHAVLLVPKLQLGNQKSKLQLRETGSWSFQVCIPKLELGNEYKEI